MRLASGTLWPIPITLDVTPAFAEKLELGETIDLRDREGVLNATLTVTDRWQPDKRAEAIAVFGADDKAHPAVRYLHDHAGSVYLGGTVAGHRGADALRLQASARHAAGAARPRSSKLGWRRVIAFQTRNPMHRAHQELTFRAAQAAEANLLIHPVVGMTKPGDVDHFTRVRCYEKLLGHYPEQTTTLSLLPLAMRMAGPREAVWHAIIRKNYGCTHLIVGRDHAGPGNDSTGKPFYGPYDAQELFAQHQDELDITMVPFPNLVYSESRAQYVPEDEVEPGETRALALRHRAAPPPAGRPGDPGVVLVPRGGRGAAPHPSAAPPPGLHRLLHRPLRLRQVDDRQRAPGQAPGAGRPPGDAARRRPSCASTCPASSASRASTATSTSCGSATSRREITKNGGIAICAPIAPYAATRRQGARHDRAARAASSRSTSRPRSRSARAATARASTPRPAPGIIKEFTGISDPYEAPENPEMRIDTGELTPDLAAHRILIKLESMGFIR